MISVRANSWFAYEIAVYMYVIVGIDLFIYLDVLVVARIALGMKVTCGAFWYKKDNVKLSSLLARRPTLRGPQFSPGSYSECNISLGEGWHIFHNEFPSTAKLSTGISMIQQMGDLDLMSVWSSMRL